MGADLYRISKPGTNPERDVFIARYDAAYERFTDESLSVEDREQARREWSQLYEDKSRHPWYFRDSYNDSSLFWKLDLSWWEDLKEYLGPNGDGVMLQIAEEAEPDETGAIEMYGEYTLYPPGMIRLADECARRSELMIKTCRDAGLPDTHPEELSIEYYDTKLKRFLEFLRLAAEAGDTIDCSV